MFSSQSHVGWHLNAGSNNGCVPFPNMAWQMIAGDSKIVCSHDLGPNEFFKEPMGYSRMTGGLLV
jgi:hypothetical protein